MEKNISSVSFDHYSGGSLRKSSDDDTTRSLPGYSHLTGSTEHEYLKTILEAGDERQSVSSRNASILKTKSKFNGKDRRDSYGVTIAPDVKQHKIRFKESVKEVKVIDNWKEYNSNDEKPCCSCNVF